MLNLSYFKVIHRSTFISVWTYFHPSIQFLKTIYNSSMMIFMISFIYQNLPIFSLSKYFLLFNNLWWPITKHKPSFHLFRCTAINLLCVPFIWFLGFPLFLDLSQHVCLVLSSFLQELSSLGWASGRLVGDHSCKLVWHWLCRIIIKFTLFTFVDLPIAVC